MYAHLRKLRCVFSLIVLILTPLTDGADFPNLNLELSFFPTADGTPTGVPVANGTAFTRAYTSAGPTGGGRLLPGLLLQQGSRFLYAAKREAVYQYNPDSRVLETMNTSTLFPPLTWPSGIAYDSRLRRVVLVSLWGEGTLYNYIVPDPTNAPGSGFWTYFASMQNKDVDSITYLASRDTFYAVSFTFSPGIQPVIYKIAADGTHLGEILLPALPFDIGLNGYKGELVPHGDYLALILEPRPGLNLPLNESRIYLIDPVTSEVQLAFQRALPGTNPDTTAPDVEMRAPSNDTRVELGNPITLTAAATDSGGVQKVEFLRSGAVLGTAARNSNTSSLYSFSWANAPVGTHQISARATDNAGNMAASTAINVIVYTNDPPANTNQPDITPPTVEMRSPENGSSVREGEVVRLSARAIDPGVSSVQYVEFLRNGQPLGRGANTPATLSIYNFSWSNAPLGTNILTARAADTSGNMSTSSPVTILVHTNTAPVPTNRPPVVRLTFPERDSILPLGSVRLTASASDPDGTIRNVEFFVDGRSIGNRAPTNSETTFALEWTPPTNGTYQAHVRGTDDSGLSVNSSSVRFRIGQPMQNDRISARRRLPDNFRSGHPFEVEIEVDASRSVDSWTVEDQPPEGWRVIGISHGGRFNSGTGKVRFGPFDKDERTLKYHLISLKTNVGTFTFTGQVTADGVVSDITGDTETVAKPKHRKIKIDKDKHGRWILRIDPDDDDDGRWVVEYRDSFKEGRWIELPGATITVSETGQISVNDPNPTGGQRFYRIRFVDDD